MSINKFLDGGGEMGAITRSFNWSGNILGTPDTWPQSLRSAISIVLKSKFPMFLWWGPQLIQFYNDAYRPSLGNNGKHPAVGMRGADCWPEIWPVIKPLIDQVLAGGESTWSEDQLIPIYRNGQMEDVYWTFSYSAVPDESGNPAGVLVTCSETTDKILSLKKLNESNLALTNSEMLFRNLIQQAPVAICNLAGPDLIVEAANDLVLSFWGKTTDIIGKPIAIALPELDGQPFLQLLNDVFTSGNSYYGNEAKAIMEHQGEMKEGYYNFIYQPIKNDAGNTISIMMVATDVTELVRRRQLEREMNDALTAVNEELTTSNTELSNSEAQLQRSLRQLKENEDRFRLLADNISQMVWMTDETGWIFWYNQRWYNYTGTTLEEMMGWGWQKVHHPDHVERVTEKFKVYIERQTTWEDTFPIRGKSGEYRWFLSRAIPIKDESGKVTRWFGTNTDVTAQRKLEQQKDDFLSIASHELKTPITSLKASLQLLEKMKENPSPQIMPKLIDQAVRSMQKVSTLVEDLLNVGKMNEGQLELQKTTFNLSELLKQCCEVLKTGDKHRMMIEGDKELQVCADEHQIDQVITNFITNAIKYAPDSKDIYLTVEHLEDVAKVSVQDNGPGISPANIPHLFDRYYRGQPNGIQSSGLGLGLYICSEIVKRHGGEIGVESEPGHGSIFWFTLPV